MLVKTPLYTMWKRVIATRLKRRRFERIMRAMNITPEQPLKVLDIGCANGKDAIQFLREMPNCEIHALDLKPQDLPDDVTFHLGDAAALPFADGEFDLVISIGLLEHIEPIENLATVIKEMRRVSKACVAIVPSISTLLEPHAVKLRWPLKLHKRLVHKNSAQEILHLNYLTDHTWTKFEGFADADVERFYYLFPIVCNLMIFGGERR